MLKPYHITDFQVLNSWVTDEELLLQFSGTEFSFPLSEEQITTYQISHPDRRFYMGYHIDGFPFAFAELIPQESGNPRLARILIGDPTLRGQGLGKYLIKLLLQEIREQHQSALAELYVWEKNTAAIKCYESVGFLYAPKREMTMVYKGVAYHIHKMTYTFQKLDPQQA